MFMAAAGAHHPANARSGHTAGTRQCVAGAGHRHALLTMLAAAALLLPPVPAAAQVKASYLHTLSSFTGPLRYDWVRLHADPERNETYVIYQNLVRIFSPSGIEIFSFGDDLDVGHILDAAVDPDGNVLLLSYKDGRSVVTKCTYRGIPAGSFDISGLPEGLEFAADRLVRRGDTYYFVSLTTGSVIVTGLDGRLKRHIELLGLLDPTDRNTGGGDITGFTADDEGTIFFGIATQFRVYRVAPDGSVSSFGSSGSAPGRFGVIAGLAVDSQGHLLVADKLKCVVMVFDGSFKLLTEFGYRGPRPENLIVPDDLAVDGRDRLYVSQGRRRGVSVFALADR